MISGSGPLLLSVSHHPLAVVTPRLFSDFFGDMFSEQPGRFYQQDGDEDDEGDAVAILAAVREIADDEDFDEPKDEPARDRAADVSDPAKHRRDECFDARQQAHERLDFWIFHRIENP